MKMNTQIAGLMTGAAIIAAMEAGAVLIPSEEVRAAFNRLGISSEGKPMSLASAEQERREIMRNLLEMQKDRREMIASFPAILEAESHSVKIDSLMPDLLPDVTACRLSSPAGEVWFRLSATKGSAAETELRRFSEIMQRPSPVTQEKSTWHLGERMLVAGLTIGKPSDCSKPEGSGYEVRYLPFLPLTLTLKSAAP